MKAKPKGAKYRDLVLLALRGALLAGAFALPCSSAAEGSTSPDEKDFKVYVPESELRGWCGASSREQERLCIVYALAVLDGEEIHSLNSPPYICEPWNVAHSEIKRALVKWMQTHSERADAQSAHDMVERALAAAFPCRGQSE
jgi:hypothetical protein